MRNISLSITTPAGSGFTLAHALVTELNATLISNDVHEYNTSISVFTVNFETEMETSDRVAEFKAHEILCRWGMTETEAHNAIASMRQAGLRISKG